MGVQHFKYNKVPFLPLFDRKTGNINTTMSAAPTLALVLASRYYCDVTSSYCIYCIYSLFRDKGHRPTTHKEYNIYTKHTIVPSFIRIERGSDGGP